MGRIQAQIHPSPGALAAHTTEGGAPRPPEADHRIAKAFNAAMLAIMGRRRLIVLSGPAGERIDVLVRLARHLDVDGALVLPAGGRDDATVEHLIRAAAHASLPASQRPARFDALIDHLATLLETMGTGVLLVENADRLSAAALSDLVKLSGTQSETGRFLQVVLAGSDALMRRIAEDERDLFAGIAVAVPMAGPASNAEATPSADLSTAPPVGFTPSDTVQKAEPAAPVRPDEPLRTAPAPQAGEPLRALVAPAETAPIQHRRRLQAPLPRMRPLADKPLPMPGAAERRRKLWVAGAGLAAVALVVSLAPAPRWLSDAAAGATQSVADIIDRFRSLRPADAAFSEVARTLPMPATNLPAPTAGGPAPARIVGTRTVDQATQPSLPAPVAAPPELKPPATDVASAPPPAERPSLPVEALSMREPPPLDTSAALPKQETAPARASPAAPAARSAPPQDSPVLRDTPVLREPEVTAGAALVPGSSAPQEVVVARSDALRAAAPQSGSTTLPPAVPAPVVSGAPGSPAAVTALVTQARRQINDRHLTTPIGDNALETVRAMEAAAAAGIEPTRLRAAIVDSYMRLGALAEQRGQYPLARVYYRRAQQAVPDHEKIGARLEAVETRLEEIRAGAREETGRDSRPHDVPELPSLPSDAPKLR